jgi:hypothetical protein
VTERDLQEELITKKIGDETDAKIGTDKIFEGKIDGEKMDGRKPDRTQTSKEAPLRPAWGGRSADAVNHLQPKHARAIRWVNAPLVVVVICSGPQMTGCAGSDPYQEKSLNDPAAERAKTGAAPQTGSRTPQAATTATAVFAAGCFRCTEAALKQLNGVLSVTSGYAGGSKDTAN